MVENIISGKKNIFPVAVLIQFFGDQEAALKAAKIGQKQCDVMLISPARRSPDMRTQMEFDVKFIDGNIRC